MPIVSAVSRSKAMTHFAHTRRASPALSPQRPPQFAPRAHLPLNVAGPGTARGSAVRARKASLLGATHAHFKQLPANLVRPDRRSRRLCTRAPCPVCAARFPRGADARAPLASTGDASPRFEHKGAYPCSPDKRALPPHAGASREGALCARGALALDTVSLWWGNVGGVAALPFHLGWLAQREETGTV